MDYVRFATKLLKWKTKTGFKILNDVVQEAFNHRPIFRPCHTGASFLAICNAILLLGDVKLANTSFHHSLLIYF